MMMNHRIKRAARRSRHGFTLAEAMVGMAVSSITMIMVAFLMYTGARTIKDLAAEGRARTQRFRAMDQVRYKLQNAIRYSKDAGGGCGTPDVDGNCITMSPFIPTSGVTPALSEVQWLDPTLGDDGQFCRIYLEPMAGDPTVNNVMYDSDMFDGSNPEEVLARYVESMEFSYDFADSTGAYPDPNTAVSCQGITVEVFTRVVVSTDLTDKDGDGVADKVDPTTGLTYDTQQAKVYIQVQNRPPS